MGKLSDNGWTGCFVGHGPLKINMTINVYAGYFLTWERKLRCQETGATHPRLGLPNLN